MINFHRHELLKQLDDADFALWQHDLAIINRLVNAIAAFRQPQDVFQYRDSYYIPDYYHSGSNRRYVNPYKPYPSHYDMALDFLYAISVMHNIEKYYPLQRYPIYLEVFTDCIKASELWRSPYEQKWFGQVLVDRFNDCIADIHWVMNSPANKAELKRVKDKTRRQVRKVETYIDELFLRYSRLLAVRLDFGYGENADSSYELISDHRDKLLRYLREQHIGDALTGYIWKLEHGLRKGYHLHTMLFLDGSRVQQDITHGRIICDHWNNQITQGEGTAFNCNAKKDEYKHCGIGMVSHNDHLKRIDLKYACHYLTKPDEFIELMHYGYQSACDEGSMSSLPKLRVFGTGQLPPLKPRMGRPRYED